MLVEVVTGTDDTWIRADPRGEMCRFRGDDGVQMDGGSVGSSEAKCTVRDTSGEDNSEGEMRWVHVCARV